MLGDHELMAFVATTQPESARKFYGEILGLKLEEDSPFALVYAAGRTTLRVQKVRELSPTPYTSLGWKVADIRAALEALAKKGVTFVRYDGLQQDELGIWTTPDGHRVCWFKDPDGNTLSLTQFKSS
jgi:catechol 2,3-dioxygenase-like lactoylglutathione lyase family enzyme